MKHTIARLIKPSPQLSYSHWIRNSEQRLSNPVRIAEAIAGFRYTPKISVVMPVYDTPLELLDSAIGSVQAQDYENWELCICDDASPNSSIKRRLESWQEKDPRIKITYSPKNEGISGASNRALELAVGEFIGLLDHDDELSPHALYEVVNLLQEHPDADMIYSDQDKLDPEGRRVLPNFKPDWSPEFMLSVMYTGHFGVYRKRLLEDIGGFRVGFEGSQDYDLVLRISEKTDRIHHISKILYHWRMAPNSAAASDTAKPYAYVAAKRALTEHLSRRRIPGEILDGRWLGCYRLRFSLQGTDKVSIIIFDLDKPEALRNCVESIVHKTTYRNYEVIVTENRRLDANIRSYLVSQSCRIISTDESPTPSHLINLATLQAQGEYLLLLHGDTEVISPDWVTSMLGFCSQPEIGAVGAKLLSRTGRIQHVGVVLGIKGVVGYPLRGHNPEHHLHFSELIRNWSAVSGACMMVRKVQFQQLGGFDERLPDTCNDIDFCLRIREAGYRIVWTPNAELYHDGPLGSDSIRGSQAKYFKHRWAKTLKCDPYYSPNLTLRYEDLSYRV